MFPPKRAKTVKIINRPAAKEGRGKVFSLFSSFPEEIKKPAKAKLRKNIIWVEIMSKTKKTQQSDNPRTDSRVQNNIMNPVIPNIFSKGKLGIVMLNKRNIKIFQSPAEPKPLLQALPAHIPDNQS